AGLAAGLYHYNPLRHALERRAAIPNALWRHLIVGGAFGIFQKTKAVDAAILWIADSYNKSKIIRMLLIPILMSVFSFAGATFGMSEEVIPFILVFVPLALILGYDTVTGTAIPFIGSATGFASAFLNPFTVGIAQGISGLRLFSGIEYRVICWVIFTSIAIFFVMRYARKIKLTPEKSITYKSDIEKRKKIKGVEGDSPKGLSGRNKFVLAIFLSGLAVLIYGVLEYGWYIEEICAVFLITGIAVGFAGKLKVNEITESFIQGAKDLAATAFIIALARGILIISQDGKIIDTILYYLSGSISGLHPVLSSQAMFIMQTMINFFVPSGSGQAVLTMPVMAPLSDLIGVSRQTAVLAFQFGDGFSNLIIPTSAVTMGILTLAEIPWEKWARWILPLEIIFLIAGLLLLIPPYFLGINF
ncbi:MAG: AbgT family transporter, partial [Ignavibacteriaceae bacterium]